MTIAISLNFDKNAVTRQLRCNSGKRKRNDSEQQTFGQQK